VFEPNDEPLGRNSVERRRVSAESVARRIQGQRRARNFVKCDKETTTQNDIDLGIVNILVGFAPLEPAEFVIIKLQQMAGQIQT
jgi:phage tail sheath protein FI